MKRTYYIVEVTDGSFMVYTSQSLPKKMIMAKIDALGYTEDEVKSITQTNKAKDIIAYRQYTYNIDEVYDENQGEGGFQF